LRQPVPFVLLIIAMVSGAIAWAIGPAGAFGTRVGFHVDAAAAPLHTRPASEPCQGVNGSSITKVIVFVEENRSEPIVKKASMPYLKSLTAQCGLATNAHNLTHPSSGNYFGLTSGQVEGGAWSHDGGPGKYPQSQDNIFHQLGQAGKSWGVFAQSMPSNCYRSNVGAYYVRHTAAPYFDDINGRGGSSDTSCATNDVPLGDPQAGAGNNLYNALYGIDGAQLPAFSLIAPDVCHDLHGQSGTCSGPLLYTNADQFLQTWIPLIVASPDYLSGSAALLITWDEGRGLDETSPEDCWAETIPGKDIGGKPSCWIADIVVSPGTAMGARSSLPYNHYDVLAAIETLLALPVLPNNPGVSGSANGTSAQFLAAFGLS
jgi:phosphatidylinositol-3-phosphatase